MFIASLISVYLKYSIDRRGHGGKCPESFYLKTNLLITVISDADIAIIGIMKFINVC